MPMSRSRHKSEAALLGLGGRIAVDPGDRTPAGLAQRLALPLVPETALPLVPGTALPLVPETALPLAPCEIWVAVGNFFSIDIKI